jgi:hypothetical protein
MMEPPVHDNILYAFIVASDEDQSQSYTIRLHTAYLDRMPHEYTDIVFSHTVAHHFECELPNSILFDVEETPLEQVYADHQDLFEKLKNYGWPCTYKTGTELVASLKAKNIKAFAISASYGLDGWIWAEAMTLVRRDDRKQFPGG